MSDAQDLYRMQLHQNIQINNGAASVTRVPGGWVYEFTAYNAYPGGIVFVPFDNDLQPKGK